MNIYLDGYFVLNYISVRIYYEKRLIIKKILIDKFIEYITNLNNDIINDFGKHNVYYVNDICNCKLVYNLLNKKLGNIIQIEKLQVE